MGEDEEDNETILILSILNVKDTNAVNLPKIGDVVTGRINRKLMNINPTSILIEIRNLTNTTTTTTPRFYVRCCMTELMNRLVNLLTGKIKVNSHMGCMCKLNFYLT